MKTVAPNWDVKCTHSPSWVPGLPQTSPSVLVSARILIRSTASPRYGESFTSRSRNPESTTPTPAAVANDRVHPHAASAVASGVAAAIAPSWPTMPVSCVTNGACFTRNHTATTRSREVKIIASPAPSMIRAAIPTSNDPANANQN